MKWVVKVGSYYLETLCWLILTEKQSQAEKFTERSRAKYFARICRKYPDYHRDGVKLVRLVPRTK